MDFVPGLPAEAIPLMNQRDALREANSADPEIPCLNSEIDEAICVSSCQKHKLSENFKPFSVQNVEDTIQESKSSSAMHIGLGR